MIAMKTNEIRQTFLEYFQNKNHKIVPAASLIPQDISSSSLFTVAGMQQFRPYFIGLRDPFKDIHPGLAAPLGTKNVATIQKCLRTIDIDSIGDNKHLTFFEMLGNFSFGGYFKKEAINYAFEFVTKILKIAPEKLQISVFKGNDQIPFDEESYQIWKALGIKEKQFILGDQDDNFWGPIGEEGPCGRCTEIYNQGIEIWNLVFNEFYQKQDKSLEPLKIKGVDTGAGLERMTLITEFPDCQKQNKTIFDIDTFLPLIDYLKSNATYYEEKAGRIIADHFKASIFLISEGLAPSNVEQGYILRRLIRRIVKYQNQISLKQNFETELLSILQNLYGNYYPEILNTDLILKIFTEEKQKFAKTLQRGLKELEKMLDQNKKEISGKEAFYLFETFGFPIEMILEEMQNRNIKVNVSEFQEEFKKHKEISRIGAEKKFGGHGLKNDDIISKENQKIVKLHTATHLLLQALREVLDKNITQKGSDISSEKLRLDFPFPRKLTPEEITKIEELVNQKIQEGLEVTREEKELKQALQEGYLGVFMMKYPDKVTTYNIGGWSKEICAGPHVKNTKEIGPFKIIKEESSSAGIRRIKATLTSN